MTTQQLFYSSMRRAAKRKRNTGKCNRRIHCEPTIGNSTEWSYDLILMRCRFGKDDEFTEENLKSFVKQKSGVYLPLAGCLEEFDNFAAKLMGAKSAGEKGKAMAEAENALTSTPSGDKSKAEIYVKIMRKVVRDGLEVPMKEIARIKKVLEGGKISDDKKLSMKHRLNVLRAFTQTQEVKRDEL